MSTFTLAISCLTTSNLPWFMDLTFQVPMQYCFLQHQTLLLSSVTSTNGYFFCFGSIPSFILELFLHKWVTSTNGYCFCFGSIPSFILELFLHWSPVAYWEPTDLGSSSFSVLSFPFHTVHSGRMWSTREGNSKPLYYSCLENPVNSMNSMKRQCIFLKLTKVLVVTILSHPHANLKGNLKQKLLWRSSTGEKISTFVDGFF